MIADWALRPVAVVWFFKFVIAAAGSQTLPAYLERVERIIPCTPEQRTCGQCGREKPVFGYEVSEVLAVKPAEYYVQVNKLEKCACKDCEEQGVSTAPVPERIVPKSMLSDQVIVDIVVAKYCDSLPLYRQNAMLKRMFTLRSARGYWDKHFKLSNFAALGEFSLRDYRGREMGKRFGEAYIEGVEQGFGRGAWRGDAETGSLSFYLHFHCAQHLELSEAFFDG